MEIIALDTVDTGGRIIKRPSDHSFQPVSVGLVTQVFRVLDFMFDSVTDVVDDVFGLHENRVQRRTGVDGPAVKGLGGDFRLAAVDEEDAETAEDQGQRQGDAADDGQKAGPYGLHHERVPPLCSWQSGQQSAGRTQARANFRPLRGTAMYVTSFHV